MKLLLDLGNSRIKWGVRHGDAWVAQGTVAHGLLAELASILSLHAPQSCYGVNVAGSSLADAVAGVLAGQGLTPHWLRSMPQGCGVRNGYEQVAQLGADRWAALMGARALFPEGALLVVCAGTATTVDGLSADGRFLGGAILPGAFLMRRALAGNTAQLPFADGRAVLWPTNTADAITTGCLMAQAGAVEKMHAGLAAEGPVRCVLSGGGADEWAGLLTLPVHRVENLVLEGLARVVDAGLLDVPSDTFSGPVTG